MNTVYMLYLDITYVKFNEINNWTFLSILL